jgi:hypothetical protein
MLSMDLKFIFAKSTKTLVKSQPTFDGDSQCFSVLREKLLCNWGCESRYCQSTNGFFPQTRALYLLRKKQDMPLRMRIFGRFVLHANDYYALQRRILIQRVSHRIQRPRNWHRDVKSFFESWRRVRPRRFALLRSYRLVERTHNASLLYCFFRKWKHFALYQWRPWSQKALLQDVHKRSAHVSSRIFLTEWKECYTIRRQTLRHFFLCMRPRARVTWRVERQVTSSRITDTIQSRFKKWRWLSAIMRQAISLRIIIGIQSNVGIWSSVRIIMQVIISKWRAYSGIWT